MLQCTQEMVSLLLHVLVLPVPIYIELWCSSLSEHTNVADLQRTPHPTVYTHIETAMKSIVNIKLIPRHDYIHIYNQFITGSTVPVPVSRNHQGRRGTTADIGDNFLPSLTVFGCSLTDVEVETGPLSDVVFPSFLLPSSFSFPWYCALYDLFAEAT